MNDQPALNVKDGPLAGRRCELEAELVVGRENADLTIDDPELSRRHAIVRRKGEALEIEDLGSLNGTWVNGARIDAATLLAAGDTIRLGVTVLEVELPGSSGAAPTAASPVVQDPSRTAATPRPAPPPPAPAEPARAAQPPTPAPEQPFGVLAEAIPTRRRRVATRELLPEVLTILVVIGTAVALVLYFALR